MTIRAAKNASTHVIRIYHTDSGIGFDRHESVLEVVATDPREPTPPTAIEWGTVERYGIHVDHHSSPMAYTLGVRYPSGLAACLRAWGCRVVRVLATSIDSGEAGALALEMALDA